ncbi:MAG: type VI-A CRISPR-associated RNA-guided ribonuclease Cas13a [Hyphomonadaceae bacterium]
MKIVKPYGRSEVVRGPAGSRTRVVRLRRKPDATHDVAAFVRTEDRLVLNLWISVLDKIAAKPVGSNGPTPEQRTSRQMLGDAIWRHLGESGLLTSVDKERERAHLKVLWDAKVAPYGERAYREPRQDRAAPSPAGPWFDRFVGDVGLTDRSVSQVVGRIHTHLYESEFREGEAGRRRRSGRVARTAKSIADAVAQPAASVFHHRPTFWTPEDETRYERGGDVALAICQAITRLETMRAPTPDMTKAAATELYAHYGRLFVDVSGKALAIPSARADHPGLFNLHTIVKAHYARLIKHHQSAKRALRLMPLAPKDEKAPARKLADRLPRTTAELLAAVKDRAANRDLNALIRLGKVVHYSASGDPRDHTSDAVKNWPMAIDQSVYWTTDGQTIIKRNEAFVRIFRRLLTFSSRTLSDWVDPKGQLEGDILLRKPIEQAVGAQFDWHAYRRKLPLLLGSRAPLFERPIDDGFERGVLRLALEGVSALRNAAFHFKGFGAFAAALTTPPVIRDATVAQALETLWREDCAERANLHIRTMTSARCDAFFNRDQNARLADATAQRAPRALALPRFARVLKRAAHVWNQEGEELLFPAAPTWLDLQTPARQCQYTSLKLLYESGFRDWLSHRRGDELGTFIDLAIKRTTDAARALNAAELATPGALITARAANIMRNGQTETIDTFFASLAGEATTELRLHRHSIAHPGHARSEATYIENLKCDVVALAFRSYLRITDFGFVLALAPDADPAAWVSIDLTSPTAAAEPAPAEPWQQTLYFLMHLAPVEEAHLLHDQIRKWRTLALRGGAAPDDTQLKLLDVFDLYVRTHDIKFQRHHALTGIEPFDGLYESKAVFGRMYPPLADDAAQQRLPQRGLREIMRFGHLPILEPIFRTHRVNDAEAIAYLDGESAISHWEERRQSLHDSWTQAKDLTPQTSVRDYVDALRHVVQRRHLAAHATLTNHVRLHRLLMNVLGRLVDYSGIWERDLYFAVLALTKEGGAQLPTIFNQDGLRALASGQIVMALRNLEPSPEAQRLRQSLTHFFGPIFAKKSAVVRVRNELAHFNMLRPSAPPLDLTDCVNATRFLMAYDIKMRNSVSRAIADVLYRSGLTIAWTREAAPDKRLGASTLKTRQARHLGRMGLHIAGNPGDPRRPRTAPINENLHGDRYVAMVAALFGQCTPTPQRSVLE